MSEEKTFGKDLYDRQIEALENNDVPAIGENYHEDAILLNFDYDLIEGKEAITEHFKHYISNLGYLKLVSTDQWLETDDSIFFEATVETGGGTASVYDAFYFKDGKIFRHYTGLKGFTPKES